MNGLGLSGALSIWVSLIVVYGWPLTCIPVFVYWKRRDLKRKVLFTVIQAIIALSVYFVVVTLAEWGVSPFDYGKTLVVPQVIVVACSIVCLATISRRSWFRNAG
jgi:hypothetical protein